MKNLIIVFGAIFLFSCGQEKFEKYYYENGTLKLEVPIQNEQRHGKLVQYYPNGNVMLSSNWSNGIKDGEVKAYFNNGKLQGEEYFINGKKEGIFSYYDSISSKLILSIEMSNGLRNGNLVTYNDNGQVQVRQSFRNDIEHGNYTKYDSLENIVQRIIYENGQVIYGITFHSNGNTSDRLLPIYINPILKNSYKLNESQGFKIGLTKSFYEEGQIEVVIGELNNMRMVDNPTKVIKSKGLYVDYIFIPSKTGVNVISGVVKEKRLENGQAITTNMQSFVYEFEILESEIQ